MADVLDAESIEKNGFDNTMTGRFDWLEKQGFDVVEHFPVSKDTLPAKVMEFADRIPDNDIPSDGGIIL